VAEAIVYNDEPTKVDLLQRGRYVEGLGNIVRGCETPMVIGLYGAWGVGKTSLMQQIQEKLQPDASIRTVWFDAWQHQFDEHPALSLLHTMVDTLELKRGVKKALITIAVALSASALRTTQIVDPEDIKTTLESYNQEYFQIRDARARLHNEFQKLILEVRNSARGGKPLRIVFSIDDLDRCMPSQIIAVLESLKLYLNLEGCVFFLAVDRRALEANIRRHHAADWDARRYLDKIIQLPFTVPPITNTCLKSFIQHFLPPALAECGKVLEGGLDANPREIKRFINALLLVHNLAAESMKRDVLATILLIQYRNFELYSRLIRKPSLLHELLEDSEEGQSLREMYLEGDEALEHVLKVVKLPDPKDLKPYIFLTDVARIPSEVILEDELGFYTEEGLEQLLFESGMLSEDEIDFDKLLLFETDTQRTWLIATKRQLFCVLDDEKSRRNNRVIRWRQPLSATTNVKAYQSENGKSLIDVGPRRRWLYSRRLHPNPRELQEKVQALGR
jgi:hypothetical protein